MAAVRRLPAPTSDETADYTDAVAVSAGSWTPEQWARAALEGLPAALRWFVVVGWVAVLRLRLGPLRSPDHVVGWTVAESSPERAVLTTESSFLTGRLEFRLDGGDLVWSTFVGYRRAPARVLWPPVSVLHRVIVPYALGRAARSAARSTPR